MYPVYPPASKGLTIRDMGMGVGTYAVLALLFLVAVNVIILLWGIGQVYPHMDKHVYLFIITPWIVNFAELGGVLFFLYYVLLAIAITASFIWMLKKSYPTIVEEVRAKYPEKGHSPLYVIGTIFMANIAFNIIFYLLVDLGGTSPTTPGFADRSLWELLYAFAEASVWEEVVSRILLIGVPLLLVDALLEAKNPEKKMKKARRYLLGGDFTIGRKEGIFLMFSAVMFGIAHVWSWDLFKIIPTLVGGLALGYLFLKFGVYASILLHFAIDYLSIPLELAPDSLALIILLNFMIIAWVVIGIPYIVMYAARALGWLIGRRVWPDLPRTPPREAAPYYPPYQYQSYPPAYPQPPAYGPGPAQPPPAPPYRPAPARPSNPTAFGFTCRNCGNTEAGYKDGQLICTRCGKN